MAKTIIWTESAANDLQRIVEYIAIDSENYAVAFYDAAREIADSLSTFSNRGRVVPEINNPTIREVFIHRYRLMYQVYDSEVIVLAIIHGAMKFKGSIQ
jgi:plasmid stabilization system protein ParE